MSRTIRKKAFDDDLMLSDDFDESILDKIEKNFSGSGLPDMGGSGSAIPSLDDDTPAIPPSFSLDDFDSSMSDESIPPRGEEGAEASASRSASRSGSSAGLSRWAGRKVFKTKLFLLAAPCVLLILAAVFVAAHFFLTPHQPEIQIVTLVKRPIPIPFRTEEEQFLILSDTQHEKTLVEVVLQLRFLSEDGSGQGSGEEVELRDSIYRFLSEGHPASTSLRSWEAMVNNDLAAYLKTSFPRRGLQSVQLANLATM